MVNAHSGNQFSGEIVVASRIVDFLSSGLYESPAACLKELVNNSYDADARTVKVFVQPDADRIIIYDDGEGMSRADFEKNFRRIAETFKRDGSDRTDMGRPKIGKIGIGFIAANEICDVMEIESTKRGSKELLNVTIDFAKMRDDLGARRRGHGDIAKGDYYGAVEFSADKASHYTTIFLRKVRGEAKQILVGATSVSGHDGKKRSLYGLTHEGIAEALRSPAIISWSDFDPYSETMLRVALNVPVRYHENWAPPRLRERLNGFAEAAQDLDFTVFYDGSELRKPVVFSGDAAFVERFEYHGSGVSAQGYFYVQHGTLRPQELNGVLIRIRHAAVGDYDSSFMGFPTSRGPLFQRWISAEIWASDELEEAMNIDRRTLRVSHPAYMQLQSAFHAKLANVLSRSRDKLYRVRNEERRDTLAAGNLEKLRSLVSRANVTVKEGVLASGLTSATDIESRRGLLRKYTIAELFEIVVDIAENELPPAARERFLAALAKRLTR